MEASQVSHDASSPLPPFHGNAFKDLLVHDDDERRALVESARSLPKIQLSTLETSDLIMLGMGAFSPLGGFMDRSDYEGVVHGMHLKDGALWPIPITLSVTKVEAENIHPGDTVSLIEPEKKSIMGMMNVTDKYPFEKKDEAVNVYGTDDEKHPGVQKLYQQGNFHLGGEVRVFHEGGYPERFPQYARPAETRKIFAERGWKTIAAFQTRNPIHRSHEYITKIALELYDALFIHPIVGRLKEGDIPADIRIKCYRAILDNYYPKEKVLMKVYPMEMRYGGPREALLHAIIRQNFGCTHLIVGRDHAGVGNYYGPFDAQEIFDRVKPDELIIKPIKIDHTFWCKRCGQMGSANTCPHPAEDHLLISGTELRRMLSEGIRPPKEFSRPEVVEILTNYYAENGG
jgi:sulfate adenylyltransferase